MKAKLTRLNIRIDYDLKDKIEKEAEEAGITQTDLVLNAIEARIERKLLVKKELEKWKIETKISLKNFEHRQYYHSEEFRLNCLHGVLPASRYDNPDSSLRSTSLDDLNKPTVVTIEDDNSSRTVPSIEDQLEEMVRKQMKKAPIEDDNSSRTVPSIEELQQMLDDIE